MLAVNMLTVNALIWYNSLKNCKFSKTIFQKFSPIIHTIDGGAKLFLVDLSCRFISQLKNALLIMNTKFKKITSVFFIIIPVKI